MRLRRVRPRQARPSRVRVRDFTSEQFRRKSRDLLRSRSFHTSTSLHGPSLNRSIRQRNIDFLQQRTQRPQSFCVLCVLCGPPYLTAGAMTFSEMTVLTMDEILLRIEISRMRREEETRRRASEQARRMKDLRRPRRGTRWGVPTPSGRSTRSARRREGTEIVSQSWRGASKQARRAKSPRRPRREMRFHCVIISRVLRVPSAILLPDGRHASGRRHGPRPSKKASGHPCPDALACP